MPNRILAIANCRVSSDEQLNNNSLNRQQQSTENAAKRLGLEIIKNWSGSVSSKAGTNINRKDLQEMLEFCKQNRAVKYAIFDEYDRFMRSVNEGPYFEVLFNQLGVKVWYASESDAFNGDDAMAKFMRSMSAYKAEGSNEERQRKSISGQNVALREGRYPFSPKPGYKKGLQRGIQEVDPSRGPALKLVLERVANKIVTPTQGLIELNKSDFMKNHSPYRMDKFRKIVTDPFYAGIVEIHVQVNERNENGLHEPLITKDQHLELLRIMNDKKKTQSGPRKNGNPKYPLSNHISCDLCTNKRNGRVVGFDLTNGKSSSKIYEKYRCRACKRNITRQELHSEVVRRFKANPVSPDGLKDLIEALNIVWKQQEGHAEQETGRIRHKIKFIQESISQQVEAATQPSNVSIREEILAAIAKKKAEVVDLEDQLEKLKGEAEHDLEEFLRFAFDFVENMGTRFLEITPESREKCKQIIFPAGFWWNENNKVYTPEISPLIRLAAIKKVPAHTSETLLVRVRGL